ncbi:MAG: hypothetical protein IPL46_23740 [Saprospiraceae bacterium]|nr:hypothetical protein [Saprospiraceae bacterium]
MIKLRLIVWPLIFMIACNDSWPERESYTCFVGGTIIDGKGGDPIQNGALLLRNSRFVA